MVLKASKFTPSVLLSAPRRSAGVPDPTGRRVLYTVSTYSFEEHRKTSQMRVLDIQSGETTVLYEDPTFSEPVWVSRDEFLFLKSAEKGTTSLLMGHASRPGALPVLIQTFDGGLSNLKTFFLRDGALAFALTGLADPSGQLYNPDSDASKSKPKHNTARVYTKLFVRHWDAYVTENTQTIWYGRLERTGPAAFGTSAKAYAVTSSGPMGGLANALIGTKLQSPVPPFGGASDFSLSQYGIAFVSRDPAYVDALYTVSNVYIVPLRTYAETQPLAPPYAIRTGTLVGYSANPVFSPDGYSLAFTRMRNPQYESDKTHLLLVPDITKVGMADVDTLEFYATKDGVGAWDARPDAIVWRGDGSELYVTAEHHGRNSLYRLPSHPNEASIQGLPQLLLGGTEVLEGETPVQASGEVDEQAPVGFRHLGGYGSVTDVRMLAWPEAGDGRLFLSLSSLIDSSFFSVLDPSYPQMELKMVSSLSRNGSTFGLSPKQVGEIWFKGAGDYNVHALVMRPSDFDAEENRGRKWPLALLIHGGPQGAWNNSWSTRWNPAVFAEQGYVVVAPNPTGSTGYGMALQDGIQNQWGGRPYEDIVCAMNHVAATFPYVDMTRAVALGASYGGYMINWIQGQPLGRRFKALVNHDGVFSTLNQYSSEELFFPLHDFGGSLWDHRAGYEKWDPATYTGNWATPTLIIHNELDYRLPVTEGLAAFNVLQSRKVPSRFLSFPDENHWVLKPENSLVWHQEVLGWINKYSGVWPAEEELAEAADMMETNE